MTTVGSGDFRFEVDASFPSFPANGPAGEAIGVACDSRDRVHVYVRGPEPMHLFERDGTPAETWGAGVFARPHGICIDGADRVYCTDDFDHTVRVFAPDHAPQLTLGASGHPSDTGATSIDYRTIRRAGPPFHYPTNVALGPTGDLFVSDGYGNARVHRFRADGQLLLSWGEPGSGPGQFHVPHGIAVDGQGIVYVADRENSRIQRFTSEGAYLDEWPDLARPCQVFIDGAGHFYIAELGYRAGRWPGTGEAEPGATGGRVSILDREGNVLVRWGGGANPCAAGDFYAPHDICVDSRGDVYVAEVAWSAGGRTGKVPGNCHTLQKFVRLRQSLRPRMDNQGAKE